jgi:hypothetical protein
MADDTAVVEAGADTAAVDIQDTAIFFSLNEQNHSLPGLKTGQMKKKTFIDTFHPKKTELKRPKHHLTLLTL